jgi:lysophospholipase L1-like esterase
MRPWLSLLLILAVVSPLGARAAATHSAATHWVATWTNAQPLIVQPPPPPPPPAPPGTPPRGPDPVTLAYNAHGFDGQTLRMIVHTSIGGRRLRIRLSNPFGGTAFQASAHVALRTVGSQINTTTDRALTFSGQTSFTLGPGMILVSDPVDLATPPQTDVAVTLYVPGQSGPPSSHNGLHTTYITHGDALNAPSITDPETTPMYYWLVGLDVDAPSDAGLIVALGDSITEGWRSTSDANRSWPAALSQRLAAGKGTAHVAVANMGIGGNRLLHDGNGANALARFDRDVLGQPGVKWMTLLEGINDIGRGDTDPVTAEQLIGAEMQLIERAHSHGILVVGCTLPPYEGAFYYRPEDEAIRQALNTWIRESHAFDALVDFDAATRDPDHPTRLRPEFDPGDHLHPNDDGYRAMAEAFKLPLFARRPGTR